jgi:hypothetical protein
MRLHTTVTTAGAALLLLLPSLRVEAANPSFIGPLHTITPIAFTVPSNGDVNPYGVAVVPTTVGALVAGNVLVSNFNNLNNSQGTGTTIVQITPSGKLTVFAQITPASVPACVGGVGLTTALAGCGKTLDFSEIRNRHYAEFDVNGACTAVQTHKCL